MEILENNPFDDLDVYDLRYYIEHLIDGGRSNDVHRFLIQETPLIETQSENWIKRIFTNKNARSKTIRFRNEWYNAQEKIGEIRNFVKDVGLCWSVAEKESKSKLGENQNASSVGLEARYALISSCLNNLAENIPTALLSRLLEERILNIEQALTLIDQIPNLPQRALATAVVAFQAENMERDELFELMFSLLRSTRDNTGLAKVLVKIAKTVPEASILPELTEVARNIDYSTSRVETLLELAPLLPEKLRAEAIEAALNAARETDSETDRAVNLIKVAKRLDEPRKSDELKLALEIISSFNDSSSKEYSQSEAIRDFVEVASDELLPPALAIYNTFSDKQYRAKVELALAARLFIRGETGASLQIFKSFDSPLFDTQIVWALMKIAPFVTPPFLVRIYIITIFLLLY